MVSARIDDESLIRPIAQLIGSWKSWTSKIIMQIKRNIDRKKLPEYA